MGSNLSSLQIHNTVHEHGNAHGLSRLPVHTGEVIESEAAIFNVKQIEFLPASVAEVRRETQKDPILSKVHQYTKRGRPLEKPKQHMKPYHTQ